MRRLAFSIIIILLAAVVFIWRISKSPTTGIKTEEVKRTSITKSISASGKIASEEEVELKFQTSGLLAWVGVKEGDQVQAWQVIAQLDARELQKTLEKYLRDYSKERANFEEDRLVTYKDRALTDTVKRILEKNQWDLDKAVLDVELKDIALKFATLITPISGIVTQVDTPVAGVNITPATAVFKVANPEKMIFKANIDEADIAGIILDLPAKITLDAYPGEEYEGKVTKISFASVVTSGGGTAFPVEISLPKNEGQKFKIGMNGDADIILEKRADVLAVPLVAIMEREDKHFVWLIKDGRAKKQEIKTGLATDELVEVTEGLKEGDKIIKSDVSKIKEGQKI